MALVWALLGGCVIPPPLEREPDGGGGSRPEIDRDFVVPPEGFRTFEQSADPQRPNTQGFIVGVRDPDDQTIVGRMFLNWKYSAPIVDNISATFQGSPFRSLSFEVQGLCDDLVNNDPGPHHLEVYLSDTGFDSDGFYTPNPGGQLAHVSWIFNCIPSVPSMDGGV